MTLIIHLMHLCMSLVHIARNTIGKSSCPLWIVHLIQLSWQTDQDWFFLLTLVCSTDCCCFLFNSSDYERLWNTEINHFTYLSVSNQERVYEKYKCHEFCQGFLITVIKSNAQWLNSKWGIYCACNLRVQPNKMIKFFCVVTCLKLFFFFNKVIVNE